MSELHTSRIVRDARREDIEAWHRRVEGVSRAAEIVRMRNEEQSRRRRTAALGTLAAFGVAAFVASIAVLV